MGLRRGYLIALGVALITAIASIFIPHGANGLDRAQAQAAADARGQAAADVLARRHLPEAMAALRQVIVPSGFRRFTAGGQWYRCYLVREQTGHVAPELPGILRSIGAFNGQTRLIQARMQALNSAINRVETPVYRQFHVAAANLIGCSTIYLRRFGAQTHCAYPVRIDDNSLSVFLLPYISCDPRPCRWTDETEVDISPPSGVPQASQ